MLSLQLKSLTDLRNNPLLISQLAASEGPVYILNRSRPAGVFISAEQYEQMVDIIEDFVDGAEMQKYEKTIKNKKDWITHGQLMKQLGL